MVKIRLERIDIQESVIVEVLLDSGTVGFIMSFVIRRVCGQTLGLGLVDRNRTVVIISLQWRKSM